MANELLLFIDFDGVLHPEPCSDDEYFCKTPLLWQILRTCENISVVFSTSWRHLYSFEALVDGVTRGGGENLAHRFAGKTPTIRSHSDYEPRGVECQHWLEANGHSDAVWLALDDTRHNFHGGQLHRIN